MSQSNYYLSSHSNSTGKPLRDEWYVVAWNSRTLRDRHIADARDSGGVGMFTFPTSYRSIGWYMGIDRDRLFFIVQRGVNSRLDSVDGVVGAVTDIKLDPPQEVSDIYGFPIFIPTLGDQLDVNAAIIGGYPRLDNLDNAG